MQSPSNRRPGVARPALVALVLVLGVLAAACTPSVVSFTIGDCVNLPDGETINDYESVDCEEPHDAEVFSLPQRPEGPDDPYPGQAALSDFTSERCEGEAFSEYVGTEYQQSDIFITALSPSQDSWDNAEDREVVCLLVGMPLDDGSGFTQLTGSKEGSGE